MVMSDDLDKRLVVVENATLVLKQDVQEIKKDVVELKVEAEKVKGIVTWINEKVVNNPKTALLITALSTVALTWLTSHFVTPPIVEKQETVINKSVEPTQVVLPNPPEKK